MSARPMTTTPCPRCLPMVLEGQLRDEALQPLPEGVHAPRARDGSGPCCLDCAAADGLIALRIITRTERYDERAFHMARVAVANDRQESMRLPDLPLGLGRDGLVRISEAGELEHHQKWLDEVLGDRREEHI